jgi:glucose/arabinose dehydrogenase
MEMVWLIGQPVVQGSPERAAREQRPCRWAGRLIVHRGGRKLQRLAGTNALVDSVLVYEPAIGSLGVFASGFHNPHDLAWGPAAGLWGTDQGSGLPCASPDEINLVILGRHYGLPYCTDETPFLGTPRSPALRLGMGTHAAGLAWFDSEIFAAEFRRGFFVTLPGTATGSQAGPSVQFAALALDG